MSEQKQTCFICQKGFIRRGRRFFVKTDSFYECDRCHSEFHWKGNKYLLQNIPENTSWKKYEGQLLSQEEIKRIMKGGLSDAEIAKEKAEEEERKKRADAEIAKKMAEEEEQKRREQQPGTPENYQLRFRNILGLTEGQIEFVMEIEAKSAEEVKRHIKNIIQMQKELRQLKKEIAVTKKETRSTYLARAASRSASVRDTIQRLVLEPYDDIIRRIDSAIVSLDGLKVEIENRASGFDFGTKPSRSEPRTTKTKDQPKNEAQATDESLEDLLDELNSLSRCAELERFPIECTQVLR
jgi:hypothetical protein